MPAPDTLSAAAFEVLLGAAGQRGADVPALRRTLGLPASPAALPPDARLPLATVQRFWPLAVAAAPGLDLHLGELLNPAALGVAAYVLLHSPTLGAALAQLVRYQDVACQGVALRLRPAPEWAGGQWLALTLSSPAIIYPEYVYNSELSLYLALARTLTGQPVRPAAVRLAYPRPADVSLHEQVLGPVAFGAAETAVAFDAATLALPVVGANPALFPLFEQHAAALLAALPGRAAALPDQVRQAIVALLKGQAPSLAAIANHLCLSTRTLQTHLHAAGHRYQSLLDAVRRDLAERHLREPYLSLTDLTFLLGYSELSVFVRSFKRWTGQTPGQFRQQFLAAAVGAVPGAGRPSTPAPQTAT